MSQEVQVREENRCPSGRACVRQRQRRRNLEIFINCSSNKHQMELMPSMCDLVIPDVALRCPTTWSLRIAWYSLVVQLLSIRLVWGRSARKWVWARSRAVSLVPGRRLMLMAMLVDEGSAPRSDNA
jgi:hypothetical protein